MTKAVATTLPLRGGAKAGEPVLDSAAERAALDREPAPLDVRELQLLIAELLSKHAVYLLEVLDHLELSAIDPAGEHQHQEPKGFSRHEAAR